MKTQPHYDALTDLERSALDDAMRVLIRDLRTDGVPLGDKALDRLADDFAKAIRESRVKVKTKKKTATDHAGKE